MVRRRGGPAGGVRVAPADFGASAPYKELLKHFGFTLDDVLAKAKDVMQKVKK